MQIFVATLFPKALESYFATSIMAKGIREGFFEIHFINIADFSTRNTRRADDRPFGGFSGTILSPEPTALAIEHCQKIARGNIVWFAPDPRGEIVEQTLLASCSKLDCIGFLCGHYEGIDERIFDMFSIQKISLGNFVITGGEIAAAVIIDGIVRLIPNLLSPDSLLEESFSEEIGGRKEYPQYTRPQNWRGKEVPKDLISGNHQKIEKWKKNNIL